jgi:GntR family transcriptional regulator
MSTAPRIVEQLEPSGRRRRMVLRFDEELAVPPFEQLRAQLSVMVATGLLEPGDRLPTVRDLAAQAGLAPGTVARAYRELEREGVVVTGGRRGTFVSDDPPRSEPLEERRRRLRSLAERFAFDARQLGVRPADALAAVEEALAESEPAPIASAG